MFSPEKISNILKKYYVGDAGKDYKSYFDYKKIRQNFLTCECNLSSRSLQTFFTVSNKMKNFDDQIKNFLKRKMYFHQKVHSKTTQTHGKQRATKLQTCARRTCT